LSDGVRTPPDRFSDPKWRERRTQARSRSDLNLPAIPIQLKLRSSNTVDFLNLQRFDGSETILIRTVKEDRISKHRKEFGEEIGGNALSLTACFIRGDFSAQQGSRFASGLKLYIGPLPTHNLVQKYAIDLSF